MAIHTIPADTIEYDSEAGRIYVHSREGTRMRIQGVKNMPTEKPGFIDINVSEGGRVHILPDNPPVK